MSKNYSTFKSLIKLIHIYSSEQSKKRNEKKKKEKENPKFQFITYLELN